MTYTIYSYVFLRTFNINLFYLGNEINCLWVLLGILNDMMKISSILPGLELAYQCSFAPVQILLL